MKKNVLPDGYNSHFEFMLDNWKVINELSDMSVCLSGRPTWHNRDTTSDAVEIDRDWIKARAFDEIKEALPISRGELIALFDQLICGQNIFVEVPKEYKALMDFLYTTIRAL